MSWRLGSPGDSESLNFGDNLEIFLGYEVFILLDTPICTFKIRNPLWLTDSQNESEHL